MVVTPVVKPVTETVKPDQLIDTTEANKMLRLLVVGLPDVVFI